MKKNEKHEKNENKMKKNEKNEKNSQKKTKQKQILQCTIPSLHWCMGHTAWAPEGREGHFQAGPKGRSLEVGARRAPRLLVLI